jgi:predicted AlkP superfamily phosphohydrolase/phosphomutase
MRVVVLGLDGAIPDLVFDRFAPELPHLRQLMDAGSFGRLESVVPAVTVPAWACAMTGRDPGELGIYGFAKRVPQSYRQELVDATDVRRETIWERVGRAGRSVIVVGVPPGYPPRRVEGCLVSCFMSPGPHRPYTHPRSLANEVESAVGAYGFDVAGFRRRPKREVVAAIRTMTQQRFRWFDYLLRTRESDLAILVDMGPDRIQHALLSHLDERHPRYVRDSPLQHAIRDYYRLLDHEVGQLVDRLPPDTAVLVVSDHGARSMQGGVCLNEWLERNGYLVLKPGAAGPFRPEVVDWTRTRAWGLGGYAGRVHLNLRGREPRGLVPDSERDALCTEIATGLAAITAPDGGRLETAVRRPEAIYRECAGCPPELLVEFGALDYRALGVLGSGQLHLSANDGDPDDANHDRHGLFILRAEGRDARGEVQGRQLLDCHELVADLLDLSPA